MTREGRCRQIATGAVMIGRGGGGGGDVRPAAADDAAD
jgi:hypothetical protein